MDELNPPPAVASHVLAGRSALPAFLAVETWVRLRTADAEARAAQHLESAEAEAQRVRTDGEAALRQAVIEAEQEALRDVERRSRDEVSEARVALNAWIDAGERASEEAVEDALRLICGEGA